MSFSTEIPCSDLNMSPVSGCLSSDAALSCSCKLSYLGISCAPGENVILLLLRAHSLSLVILPPLVLAYLVSLPVLVLKLLFLLVNWLILDYALPIVVI